MKPRILQLLPLLAAGLCLVRVTSLPLLAATPAPQWQEVELTFTAAHDAANPYTDMTAWVEFTHDDGTGLRRPMFWDGGRTFREWDAYRQPIGIHYSPHALNRTHQAKDWLDFQWCQTGHNGAHVPERVADMWRNLPVKAVANGEPTYENIGRTGRGAGWWQGHEAWLNLTAGGTMGVVYLPEGGNVAILSRDVPRPYRVFDPRTGEVLRQDRLADAAPAQAVSGPGQEPRVLVFTLEEAKP